MKLIPANDFDRERPPPRTAIHQPTDYYDLKLTNCRTTLMRKASISREVLSFSEEF